MMDGRLQCSRGRAGAAVLAVLTACGAALVAGCAKPTVATKLEAAKRPAATSHRGGTGKTFVAADAGRIVATYDSKNLVQTAFLRSYSGGQFTGRGTFKGIRKIKLFLVTPVADAVVNGVTFNCILKTGSVKTRRLAALRIGQRVQVSGRMDGVGPASVQLGRTNCDFRPL
ncbi:MAG: hypothetical protein AAFR04_14935 [Pseudomonadota bacterium]